MAKKPLNALILEDSEDDAMLVIRELGKQGFDLKWERAWTAPEMKRLLDVQSWDVVLSDYSMPGFDAPTALRLLQEAEQDLPFIVISGTVGDDAAVAIMKNGAHDYLMKVNLKRLGAAVEREIREAGVRRNHRLAIGRVQHLNRVLRAIRNVNQLIAHEKDPDLLLRQSCNALVNSRGYQAAWAVITNPAVSPCPIAAEQGFGDFFEEMRRRLVDGFVPACCEKALVSHGPITIADPGRECPPECPMLLSKDAGCRYAAITMISRLESNQENYGFILVEAPTELETDDEETALLSEVAGDIAFALHGNNLELRRSEAEDLFQLSFENASIGKSLTLPDGTFSRVNQAFCDLLGYTREELQSKGFADVTHPDDLALIRESIHCLLAGERPNYRMEKRYLRKDGETVWADVSTILLRRKDGTPRCFITHVLDVTERKRVEEALRESEEQLSNALHLAHAGHWEYDVDRDTFTFNDHFYQIFLTTAAEVGGYKMSSADYTRRFCHPDDADLVNEEVRAAIETPDPGYSRHFEHRILYADGEVGHLAVRFFIIKDSQGRTVKTFGVNQDITERKQYQAQIAQSDRLASMGMLAAGVAHEINNPLTYILYNLESLSDDLPKISSALRRCLADPRKYDEWSKLLGSDQKLLNPSMIDDIQARFKDALRGTLRIKDIARGLGTFSRVEQDRLVPVNLMHVIELAISMVFNEIKYRARLVKEYGKVSSITANDGRLSQVFLNLLINAAHAIPEGGSESNEIRVRTWQEDNDVFAEVRDTGSGIRPDHLPHLFEPFFTTKKLGIGTGLGLPISRNIVESYGGSIEVHSTVGEGTSFVVRLPVRTAEDYDDGERKSTVSAPPEARGRILVVDDEPGIRAAMSRMLKGNEVVQAGSGEEARDILQGDQDFDLILCDMMMPTMSGVDLHEWLLATHPALAKQVVFITGGAFTPKGRAYLAKVSNIRLDKPIDMANFKKIVGELIVAHQAKREA